MTTSSTRSSLGACRILLVATGLTLAACGGTSEAADSRLAENRKLIEARYEAVNAHDWDRFQGFYADTITWDDPGLDEPIRGPKAVRERLEAWAAAFPDLEWRLDRLFTQGDLVCAEFTFLGTHEGELAAPGGRTIPATQRAVDLGAVGVYRVRGDRIVESAIYFDLGKLHASD